jgi:radical SAM superfamily enzyme YgiQ (UPF0313 family)
VFGPFQEKGSRLASAGMATSHQIKDQVQQLLKAEKGTIFRTASRNVALVYPSPYRTGMSSLGFQQLYREINRHPEFSAERAFLPDEPAVWRAAKVPLFTFESETPVGNTDLIGISLAYELELPGMLDCLELSGLPIRAKDRNRRHPLVLLGGPLTFSNPLPAAPFVDLIVMGEGEEVIHTILDEIAGNDDRDEILANLAKVPGIYVPSIHGERLLPTIAADNAKLPAYSQIRTPNTELSDMHLVESERGCHRKCTFCVMRRSTNGGMRLASVDSIFDSIPDDARRVGLVGAAVSDHPDLIEIVSKIVGSGREIGLSSLRSDRLTTELVGLLKSGGYRTLTVASDGASERIREQLQKQIRAPHLLQAARYVAEHQLKYLKMYMMVGVPGETDADITELIEFSRECAKICNVALGIAPFVAKRNTPLDRLPFAGVREVDTVLKRLNRELSGTVDVRATSSRWAWVEWCLAQGGWDMADATEYAWKNGGNFQAWKDGIRQFQREQQPADAVLRLGYPTGKFAREGHAHLNDGPVA